MIIAQISDLHLRTDGVKLKGIVCSVDALQRTIDHINATQPKPDLVLATGDLANKAYIQDYQGLRAMLDQLDMPYHVIPGNHDDREMMRSTFQDHGYLPEDGFLHYTLEGFPLRMVGLDTKDQGREGGCLCQERLAWLDDTLSAQPDKPTLVFMHHPPFKTGISYMDKDYFIGADEMDAIIRKHDQVERIICGHLHRTITKRFGGTVASVASSTAFQMSLDLRPDVSSRIVLEPPRLPMLVWDADIGLVGHTSLLGDFGPLHPFVRVPMGPPAD